MKSFLFAAFTLCFLSKILAAGEKPSNHQQPGELENHLLRWPVIGRPFYDLLLQEWGKQGWGPLDTHWKRLQVKEPHYALLRGLLAERQGDFESASKRFAEAGKDDWALYHRARLKALTGEIPAAKTELKSLAETTQHAWIFKQSALGLGEIILLEEDQSAAENMYANLWELQKGYEMRSSILEPLFSLCAQSHKARERLETLKKDLPLESETPIPAHLEKKQLYYMAAALMRQPLKFSASRPPQPFLGAPSRLLLPPGNEIEIFTNAAGRLVENKQDRGYDSTVLLQQSMALGIEKYKDVAQILRPALRDKPELLTPSLTSAKDETEARDLHDYLAQEIFDGIDSCEWMTISLWLQLKAGDPPEKLRAQAKHLWEKAEIYPASTYYEDMPEGNIYRYSSFVTTSEGALQKGPLAPSSSIVWNLRGQAFRENAAARYKLGFNNILEGMSLSDIHRMISSRFKGNPKLSFSVKQVEPSLVNGLAIRQWLWDGRAQFGLDDTVLGPVAANASTLEQKAVDVLLRGQMQDVVELTDKEPGLAHLDTAILCALHRSLTFTSAVTTPEMAAFRDRVRATHQRLSGYILTQHPDWLSFAMRSGSPLEQTPALSEGERDELLIRMVGSPGTELEFAL